MRRGPIALSLVTFIGIGDDVGSSGGTCWTLNVPAALGGLKTNRPGNVSRSWSGPCGQPSSKCSPKGILFLSSKWSSGSWLFKEGATDGAWGCFLHSSHPSASIDSVRTQHVLPHRRLKRSCNLSFSWVYPVLQTCWWFKMCWVACCDPAAHAIKMLEFAELRNVNKYTECLILPPMHPDDCKIVTPECIHALKIEGLSMDGCDLRQPRSWFRYHAQVWIVPCCFSYPADNHRWFAFNWFVKHDKSWVWDVWSGILTDVGIHMVHLTLTIPAPFAVNQRLLLGSLPPDRSLACTPFVSR